MARKYIFSSESVTEGHPDKLCDQISDAVVDAALEADPGARVAIECLTKTGFVVLAGEITVNTFLDFTGIARKTIREAGYDDPRYGFDGENCAVIISVSEQSQDIALGVDSKEGEHGAGDQGMMFGYACNETKDYMPLSIDLAHKLTEKLAEVRKNKTLSWVRPDGKSQVSVEYEGSVPKRVATVVVSTQHDPAVDHATIRNEIIEKVIKPVCGSWLTEDTIYHVNPTGRFVVGGPVADSGLTGRKIIVDTYGGHGSHGGGAFSGKDPTKVDRSGAYMARYIAKNLVAAGLADRCQVQLAYAIGVAKPVSVLVECHGTNKIPEEEIEELVQRHFSLTPSGIIKSLNLRQPMYKKTAVYGHFGRAEFPWERLDKVEVLKQEAGQPGTG